MYVQVADRQVVIQGTDEFSQAVSMDSANAVQVDATCFHISAGTLRITAQESNDLENWEELTPPRVDFTAESYGEFEATGIAAQFVRLKYSLTSGEADVGIVAAGINTADL